MNRIPRGVIFDLDGTVYRGERLIPGAQAAIAQLRRAGCAVFFVSNNSHHSHITYAAKLTRFGIPTDASDIIQPSQVLTYYLTRELPHATLFVIGEPPLLEALSPDFRFSENPDEIDVVVASFDRTFDYRKLNIGYQALMRGARFLATNADATCPTADGEIPDAGAVIGALEGCSKRKVELVVGKPSSLVMELALERLGLSANDCLVVGDRVETDILMGHRAGMTTALVLTGVTRRADLAAAPVQPGYVLESIAEVPMLFGFDVVGSRPHREENYNAS